MNKGCLIFLGLIVVAIMMVVLNPTKEIDSKPRTSISEYEAKATAEMYIEPRLKSPLSAVFSSVGDTQFETISNGYIVHGYVDSENSFGAMLRKKYSITVVVEDGSVKCGRLKLE